MFRKLFLISIMFALSACAGGANMSAQSPFFDVPAFNDMQSIYLDARDIIVVNDYAEHKYNGEYAAHFAEVPYDVFEDYLKARFRASGQGDSLYLVIRKASLIHMRESLGGSNDDDFFALDFTVDVMRGDALERAKNKHSIQVVQTLRQRRDLQIQDRVIAEQRAFLSRTIAKFDRKMIKALGVDPATSFQP